MHDDQYDDFDDDDDDSASRFAQERNSIPAMERSVREYLVDPTGEYKLSEEKANELIAKPEAQKAIESGVNLRSFVYYVGDRVAELAEEN